MGIKRIVQNRIVIAITSFLIGGASVWTLGHYRKDDGKPLENPSQFALEDKFLSDFFNQDFFDRSRDPFEEMRRMRERMLDQFDDRNRFEGVFDDWYKGRFGGGTIGEISQREDQDFVYLEIDLAGQTPKNFNVRVENQQVHISGETESKSSGGSLSQSKFGRSFPVPQGVDGDKFKLESSDGKVIVKFPKRASP